MMMMTTVLGLKNDCLSFMVLNSKKNVKKAKGIQASFLLSS